MTNGPKGTAIDVGAHRGIVTYFLQQLKIFQQIISFEPHPVMFKQLKTLADNVPFPCPIRPYHCALGTEFGNCTLITPTEPTGKQRFASSTVVPDYMDRLLEQTSDVVGTTERQVPIRVLDDFPFVNKAMINFMKIDVEGSELEVLAGARKLLQKHKPLLLIEIAWVDDVLSTIRHIEREFDYTCKVYSIASNSLISVNECTNLPYNFFFMPNKTR